MLISIDVNSDNLYIAEGAYSSGVVKIEKAGQAKLPPATVEDGIIKNHAAFAMTVEKLLAAKGIKPGPAVMAFNSGAMLSRRLELPDSKPRELAQMIKNEMVQMVNSTSDFVYEYSVINDTDSAKTKKINLWAYAIPKDIVDEYASIFKNQKLKPVALDAHPNSVEKLFINSAINGKNVDGSSTLFIQIEEDCVEIHLFSNNQRAFSRLSPISAAELKSIFGNYGIYSGASDFWDHFDIGSDQIRNDQILNDAVHQYINHLAEELQKMVQFQLRRDASNPVTGVYIYGSLAAAKGLDLGLSSALGINTEAIATISKVNAGNMKIVKYINAIGSLIRL